MYLYNIYGKGDPFSKVMQYVYCTMASHLDV